MHMTNTHNLSCIKLKKKKCCWILIFCLRDLLNQCATEFFWHAIFNYIYLFTKVPVSPINTKYWFDLMNLNLLHYPSPMYPGKYGNTQFFPLLHCFAKLQNEPMVAATWGWTLEQAHMFYCCTILFYQCVLSV